MSPILVNAFYLKKFCWVPALLQYFISSFFQAIFLKKMHIAVIARLKKNDEFCARNFSWNNFFFLFVNLVIFYRISWDCKFCFGAKFGRAHIAIYYVHSLTGTDALCMVFFEAINSD